MLAAIHELQVEMKEVKKQMNRKLDLVSTELLDLRESTMNGLRIWRDRNNNQSQAG